MLILNYSLPFAGSGVGSYDPGADLLPKAIF